MAKFLRQFPTRKMRITLFGIVLPLLLGGLGELVISAPIILAEASSTLISSNSSTPTTVTNSTPNQLPEVDNQKNGWFVGSSIAVIGLLYLIVLWRYPLLLLKLPSEIPIPENNFLPKFTSVPIPIIRWLKYHPRVLNKWVLERIEYAREKFETRVTVKERSIHIPLPVEFDGDRLACLTPETQKLRQTFTRQAFRLLIVGEGGSGKTSLACELARWLMTEDKTKQFCDHQMLPVLIEDDLTIIDSETPLLDNIRLQLRDLRGDDKPISDELLKQLLEKRHILVILDHLSEMSEVSRKALQLRNVDSPVNALIVTSRMEDILGKEITCTMLRPMRVSENSLSIFMDTYLVQQQKRDLFNGADYFDALYRLSLIVTDDRDITVLFAKLYADQMIAVAEGKIGRELPKNIPDLMISYLNELNRNQVDGQLSDTIVHRDAKLIAWMCLEPTFKPETTNRDEALAKLATLENSEAGQAIAEQHLKYLEGTPLHLIRLVPPEKTRIRFTLDPLAEYLAGLHLVETFRDQPGDWQSFIEQVKHKPENLKDIRGFLLAVRDCCLVKSEYNVPSFVADKLGKLANLDLEVIAREQHLKRLQRLKFELLAAEVDDRLHAIKLLATLAPNSECAVSMLVEALDNTEPQVRQIASSALGKAGWDTRPVIEGLIARLNDDDSYVRASSIQTLGQLGVTSKCILEGIMGQLGDTSMLVRRSAIQALGQLGINSETVIEALIAQMGDMAMRVIVIETLGKLGITSTPVINMLIIQLTDSDANVRNSTVQALGELGISSDPVIKALTAQLTDNDANVRNSTVQALGELGISSDPVIKALTAQLTDNDANVRNSTVQVLGKLGISSDPVIKALTAQLTDNDANVRNSVIRVLEKIGFSSADIIKALVVCLTDNNADVRFIAVYTLGHLGNTSNPIIEEELVLRLADDSKMVRRSAVQALARLGTTSELAIKALIELLSDSSVSHSVFQALENLGISSEPVIEALILRLTDDNWITRNNAVKTLGKLGVDSEPVIHALRMRLIDDFATVRISTVHALVQLGINLKIDIEELIVLVNNTNLSICKDAIRALGQLGIASTPVIDTLVLRLEDDSLTIRTSTIAALGILGVASELVIEGLITQLTDNDSSVYNATFQALRQLNCASDSVIQALVMRTRDDNPAVRNDAFQTLGYLGQKSENALRPLLKALQDKSFNVRHAAARSLGISGCQSEVEEALKSACKDQNKFVREAAEEALNQIYQA